MSTYHPFGSGTYNLANSISSTANTITLSSFLEPVTGTPYTMALLNTDIAYGTIAPRTSSSEFISFTGITQNADGTATLTGVTRGLAKKSPFTSDSAYKLPHSGQSQFIISDAPQVFEKYPAKENAETVAGDWTFTGNVTFNNFPVTPSNSDASKTVKGVTKLSKDPDSASNPIAVGANVLVAYAIDSVGTDSYAITPDPAITAYAAGQIFTFKAGTANTGATTLNVNGLGAKTIKKNSSQDLDTGDIVANQVVTVVYDGTNMQLQSRAIPSTGTPLPTTVGGTGVSTAVSYTSGVTTRVLSAVSGAVTIAHGLGVTPKRIKIYAFYGNNSTSGAVHSSCIGTYDGTTNRSITVFTGVGAGAQQSDSTTNILVLLADNSGSNTQTAVATFDATNITLTWTKNGTPTNATAELLWEAFAF